MPIFPSDIGSISVITHEHQKTHEGRYFSGGYYNNSVTQNSSIELLISVGDLPFHAKPMAHSEGSAEVYFFENAIVNVEGTAIEMTNHNRSSAKVADISVFHTPTITSDGTLLDGIGLITAGKSSGGDFGFADEFILSPNKNYLFRITSISSGSMRVSLALHGYQPNL